MSALNSQGRSPSSLSRQPSPAGPLTGAAPAAGGGAGAEPVPAPAGLTEALGAGLRATARIIDAAAQELSEPGVPGSGGQRPAVATTGVIFVHGIGSQKPGETLLQWSAPLIEVLTSWRRAVGLPAGTPRDPIQTAKIDFESELPTIEVEIPAHPEGSVEHPAARWLMTESWWAAKVAPPSLSTMTNWLGPQNGATQIVNAILGNRNEGSRLLRTATAFVIPFVSVLSAVILSGYALIRAVSRLVPIDAVRNAAIFQTFDDFLTGWFGDVRVLLFDPAQSANIRAGLADAVGRLRDHGAQSIVVMAHSGGAMVSYLTLVDPAYEHLRVNKLITFGEGWNLAITLTPNDVGMADRLRRDITAVRRDLRWRDFWGSHDPAPAGAVKVGQLRNGPADEGRIRSTTVWNRRSLLDDHGTYFENDEEFTLPVLREIDTPNGWASESRFYPTMIDELPPPAPPKPATAVPETAAAPALPQAKVRPPEVLPPADDRARRHRERVAILALWRQLALAVPVATVALILVDRNRLSVLGASVVPPIQQIPIVKDVLIAVVDWLRKLHPPDIGLGVVSLADVISWLGLATLQAIVIISVLQLVSAPVQAYQAWPKDSGRRRLFIVLETIVLVGLALSLIPVLVVPDHHRLLGAREAWWFAGVPLTIATVIAAVGGSKLIQLWPGGARLFGIVAVTAFTVAMVASVLTMFERSALETGELGYIVIWLAFGILYRVGHERWSQWDRAERRWAYDPDDPDPLRRRAVWFSMFGFTAAIAALTLFLLDVATPVAVGTTIGAVILIVIGATISSRDWTSAGNTITEPGAIVTARGRV